jgi:hypothetical protein
LWVSRCHKVGLDGVPPLSCMEYNARAVARRQYRLASTCRYSCHVCRLLWPNSLISLTNCLLKARLFLCQCRVILEGEQSCAARRLRRTDADSFPRLFHRNTLSWNWRCGSHSTYGFLPSCQSYTDVVLAVYIAVAKATTTVGSMNCGASADGIVEYYV